MGWGGGEDTALLLGTQARLKARMKLRPGAVGCQRFQMENISSLSHWREPTAGQDECYW